MPPKRKNKTAAPRRNVRRRAGEPAPPPPPPPPPPGAALLARAPEGPNFLGIPRELRDDIFNHLFEDTVTVRLRPAKHKAQWDDPAFVALHPIRLVNRQVAREANDYLRLKAPLIAQTIVAEIEDFDFSAAIKYMRRVPAADFLQHRFNLNVPVGTVPAPRHLYVEIYVSRDVSDRQDIILEGLSKWFRELNSREKPDAHQNGGVGPNAYHHIHPHPGQNVVKYWADEDTVEDIPLVRKTMAHMHFLGGGAGDDFEAFRDEFDFLCRHPSVYAKRAYDLKCQRVTMIEEGVNDPDQREMLEELADEAKTRAMGRRW